MGHSYRDLIAWQKSMAIVTEIYRITEKFPKHEMYGLAAQIRRAAVSVPSNIAEGQGRSFDKEFGHFLSNAQGSLMEVETQMEIAFNLGYVTRPQCDAILGQCAEVGRIINGLLHKVKRGAAGL